MEEQLDEAHSQNKLLESERFSLEQQHRVLGLQLEEVRTERDKLICNKEMTSKALNAKDEELQNAKQVLCCYMYMTCACMLLACGACRRCPGWRTAATHWKPNLRRQKHSNILATELMQQRRG